VAHRSPNCQVTDKEEFVVGMELNHIVDQCSHSLRDTCLSSTYNLKFDERGR